MDIPKKIEYAEKAIDMIAGHDDVSVEEVQNALRSVEKYIKDAEKEALKRRAAKNKEK